MIVIEKRIHAHDLPIIPLHVAKDLPQLLQDLWFAQKLGLETTALRVRGRVTIWYDAETMTYHYKQELDENEIEL